MLITAYRPHPSVVSALQLAAATCERQEEIAMLVRARHDLAAFVKDTETAVIAVLDLRTLTIDDAVQLSTQVLQIHPFVKLSVVAVALPKALDQQKLYTLGRIGVASLPVVEEAATADYWQQHLASQVQFGVVDAAFRRIQQLMTPGPRADWLMRIVAHASVPSIKILAERLYPSSSHANAYKRRRLWQECKVHNVGTPEDVHAAIRLVLLKEILDSDQWTLSRVARYFGYETARHHSRSCKTRYGWSLRDIRTLPLDAILQRARVVFREHASWEVHSMASTPS